MGPRIILRGAIPIDSTIGGSGHRPLLREDRARSVSCGCFCLSGFWSVVCVCVALLVFSFSCPCFLFFGSVSLLFRSSVVAEAVLPLVASGTTAPSGTTALQRGTTAMRRGWGLYRGQGEFLLPHTHSLAPSLCSSLFSNRRRGRALADLPLRGAPLHFLRWNRSPPCPLAMDAGVAPVPCFLLSRFPI